MEHLLWLQEQLVGLQEKYLDQKLSKYICILKTGKIILTFNSNSNKLHLIIEKNQDES